MGEKMLQSETNYIQIFQKTKEYSNPTATTCLTNIYSIWF